MDSKTSWFKLTPPIFDGNNYQQRIVKMETYLEALNLWKDVEENYEVVPVSNNPTISQMKA